MGQGRHPADSPQAGRDDPSTPGWTTGVLLAILDALPAAVVVFDRKSRCIFANAEARRSRARAVGEDRVDPIGWSLEETVGRDAAEFLTPLFDRAAGGEVVQTDRALTGSDGTLRHLSWTICPFELHGAIVGTIVVEVDVSPEADVATAARLSRYRASRLAELQRVAAELDRRTMTRLTAITARLGVRGGEPEAPVLHELVDELDDCIAELRTVAQGRLSPEDESEAPPDAVAAQRRRRGGKRNRTADIEAREWTAPDYVALLDQLPTIVSAWDRDQVSTFSNRAALAWYGRTDRADVIGVPMRELLRQEYYEPELPMLFAALDGDTVQHERSVVDPAGSRRDLQVTHAPAYAGGEITGSYVLILDVTAKRAADNAAAAARERLAVMRERQRIADDLHNVVIQRLYAAALRARAASEAAGASARALLGEARDNLAQSLDDLARSLSTLDRGPIFEELTNAVAQVVRERTLTGSLRVTAQLIGPINDVPPRIAADLLLALSAALGACETPQRADRVDVTVAASGHEVWMRVADDGIGPEAIVADPGVTALAARAEQTRGTFSIRALKPVGALLEWTSSW
jgi:PAS domain S-box-containing protein